MPITIHQTFLQKEAISLLKDLQANTAPKFGLMTAQHMVEHLIWVTKATAGRKGEPDGAPTKSHLYFKNFIANGAIFQYRPKEGVTKNNLKPLKYASLQEAIEQVGPAIERFYAYFEQPDVLSYNPMMGELSKEELELFHAQHYRWHLYQFGLIPEFA